MTTKRLILIIAGAVCAGSVIAIVTVRLLDVRQEVETNREIESATTNMMREMKPLTAPPIFPEKQ